MSWNKWPNSTQSHNRSRNVVLLGRRGFMHEDLVNSQTILSGIFAPVLCLPRRNRIAATFSSQRSDRRSKRLKGRFPLLILSLSLNQVSCFCCSKMMKQNSCRRRDRSERFLHFPLLLPSSKEPSPKFLNSKRG